MQREISSGKTLASIWRRPHRVRFRRTGPPAKRSSSSSCCTRGVINLLSSFRTENWLETPYRNGLNAILTTGSFRRSTKTSRRIEFQNDLVFILRLQTATLARDKALLNGNTLRQISRLVNIAAAENRCVIGQQLQRNDRDDWLEEFRYTRDADHIVGDLDGLRIIFIN